jgi:hypothetical protein
MKFRDRPLLPGGIDTSLYLSRPHVEQALLHPLLSGRNVLLLGDAGAGKTTLLRWAEWRLKTEGRRTAWVNAAIADSVETLLAEVSSALDDAGEPQPDRSGEPPAESPGLLAATRKLSQHEPAVLLVDGLLDADVGFDLFGRLRDELWSAGHAWAVAIRPRDSASLRTPPADAFWSAVIEIPPLDVVETEDLLRLGLDKAEFTKVHRDIVISGNQPRLLIREVEARLDPGDQPAADAGALVERASALGRSEAMAITELVGLGRPVSAHDPELLDHLGWSRAYAQRILGRLEEEGLVRSIPERRGERSGRPRKLYEPRPSG